MAIMLQTGRAPDKERLIRFFEETDYDEVLFDDIISRFKLTDQLVKFRRIYE